jgi:signal transduction histidine kinase
MDSRHNEAAFVGVMSHELRTPLAAVLGMPDLLAETPGVPAHAMELVHAATRNAHRLLDIVNDLLDVWAVDTGTLVRVDAVDVREVIADVAATATPRAEEKGLRLELALPSGLPPVSADSSRLRHVLRHLLDNAIKFTDAGHVRVWTELDATSLRMVVGDTGIGIGIHPDDHERIFDAFVQADGSATRRHGGAGLGLAICRRLATLMRGTIGLRSAPGEGSAFWVALPCATVPADGT